MQVFVTSRTALLVAALTAASPALAQGLPATAPTASAPHQQVSSPAPVSATPASQPPHRAQVGFSTGLLTITADNSSLNQILREISSLTGMKITGGVNEERVYGTYGPGDTSTVLSTLLRGTGSNMLLIFDAHQAPSELVLTPRGGGATPPSPSASRGRDEDDLPPQRRPHFPTAAENNPGKPVPPLPDQQPQPATAVAAPVVAQPPTAPPVDSSTTTSQGNPNDVKTPQQIYEQLMKMQQQQQQKTGAAPPQ